MSWTSWFCNNENATLALSNVKTNTNPQSVYWVEQNMVYYNLACTTDGEGNDSSVNQCFAFLEVYSQSVSYQQEHSSTPNFLMPSYRPID